MVSVLNSYRLPWYVIVYLFHYTNQKPHVALVLWFRAAVCHLTAHAFSSASVGFSVCLLKPTVPYQGQSIVSDCRPRAALHKPDVSKKHKPREKESAYRMYSKCRNLNRILVVNMILKMCNVVF